MWRPIQVTSAETDSATRITVLILLLLLAANALLRVSTDLGVLVHGAFLATTVVAIIVVKDVDGVDGIAAAGWVAASLALLSVMALGLVTVRPIAVWALPLTALVPAAIGAFFMIFAIPDRTVVGLRLIRVRYLAWALVVAPFVIVVATGAVPASESLWGLAFASSGRGQALILLAGVVVGELVFRGLIQGGVQLALPRSGYIWVAALYASLFAVTWAGFLFLLALGFMLGKLRTDLGSVWPSALAAVIVSVAAWAA